MNKEELSGCEALMMKVIWDAGEDISIPDLTVRLKERFRKDYARTTVVTFLGRLTEKGFVSTYRKGRLSYAHAEKSEEEYQVQLAQRQTDFWFGGKASGLFAALCSAKRITEEEAERIRGMIDELDDVPNRDQ